MATRVDAVTGQRFSELLKSHNHGVAEHEATEKLAEVVRGIRATKEGGSVTIKINLEPIKGNINRLMVTAKVSSSVPQVPNSDVRFSDDSGALTEHDPKQLDLPGT